jgi:ABC-type spermidine/putrescine transport system permease subunit II
MLVACTTFKRQAVSAGDPIDLKIRLRHATECFGRTMMRTTLTCMVMPSLVECMVAVLLNTHCISTNIHQRHGGYAAACFGHTTMCTSLTCMAMRSFIEWMHCMVHVC